MRKAPPWHRYLTPRDVQVFAAAGYGRGMELGDRPALLVVDMTYDFAGDAPEPILDSIKRWPNSSGEEAWSAIEQTRRVLEAARSTGRKIFFTKGTPRGPNSGPRGRWGDKNARTQEWNRADTSGNQIVAEIAPEPGEPVYEKTAPSAFFGTDLLAGLVDGGIDTLLIAGITTSGCVRATVVDAFSYNYRVAVLADCTADRGQTAHLASLFDIDQKYGEVINADDAIDFLKQSAGAENNGAS